MGCPEWTAPGLTASPPPNGQVSLETQRTRVRCIMSSWIQTFLRGGFLSSFRNLPRQSFKEYRRKELTWLNAGRSDRAERVPVTSSTAFPDAPFQQEGSQVININGGSALTLCSLWSHCYSYLCSNFHGNYYLPNALHILTYLMYNSHLLKGGLKAHNYISI